MLQPRKAVGCCVHVVRQVRAVVETQTGDIQAMYPALERLLTARGREEREAAEKGPGEILCRCKISFSGQNPEQHALSLFSFSIPNILCHRIVALATLPNPRLASALINAKTPSAWWGARVLNRALLGRKISTSFRRPADRGPKILPTASLECIVELIPFVSQSAPSQRPGFGQSLKLGEINVRIICTWRLWSCRGLS